MGLKTYRPITPSQRFKTSADFSEITVDKPYKKLTVYIPQRAGRNNLGRLTMRRRGAGHKKCYRVVSFKRDLFNLNAKVESIEYDPNRSARLALICYENGIRRYILAPDGLKVGDKITEGENVPVKVGNALPLNKIPVGTMIHNVEMHPGKGGQLARSAGTFCQLSGYEKDYAILSMPSGEIRYILANCYATIGVVSNIDHKNVVIGKAGRNRWMGIRPHVRGTAMNPVDHPLGGGEGRGKGNHPQSPWGTPAKGYKTRKKKNRSNRFIVKRRKYLYL
ncbi:MAG TPA: 50S ribosomal protein L2 [Exilispira sp.]|nr:50S ribosomal protein L2 [Exilispira sp.]